MGNRQGPETACVLRIVLLARNREICAALVPGDGPSVTSMYMSGTQDERFSATSCTDLLRSGQLRECPTYPRVCHRLSQAPEHRDLGALDPTESLTSGKRSCRRT